MRKYLFIGICLLLIPWLAAGCNTGKPRYTDSPAPLTGPEVSGSGDAYEPGTAMGLWYEQADFGGTLLITPDTITYSWESFSGNKYNDECACTLVKSGSRTLIETAEEDYFSFVDMYYDREQDMVVGYTMPVLDGDGGYKYTEFRRDAYIPPPPPVYDPPVDLSDPDAQTSFEDLTIRHIRASFYDEGTEHDPSSYMMQEPPTADYYEYDLTVQEDGSALVSSSFCREIDIPKDVVDELQALAQQYDIGSINGLDIHTEGLPYDAPDYEVEIELQSGEIIRSSANGPDVPENWLAFQKEMNYLLFHAFMDAGYQLSGEFHSTKPMKRVGYAPEDRVEPGITYESVRIESDWEKAYDYSLHMDYFTFSDESGAYPQLMETLEELSSACETLGMADLQRDYETMQAAPKSVWQKEDRRFIYSFYGVELPQCFGPFYSFLLSEGHCCSLGLGEYGYGYYPHYYYNIDLETGEILSIADLFTDADAACAAICDNLRGDYSDYREIGRFIHSDEFPEVLREYVEATGPESINWFPVSSDRLQLHFPQSLFPMEDYTVTTYLYYDELQDVLNDTYTAVW